MQDSAVARGDRRSIGGGQRQRKSVGASRRKSSVAAHLSPSTKGATSDWVALNDGGNLGSINYEHRVTRERTRHRPAGLQERFWSDGSNAYVFLGRCTQCREEIREPEIQSLHQGSEVVCFNLCGACSQNTVTKVKRGAGRRYSVLMAEPDAAAPVVMAGESDADLLYRVASPPKSVFHDLMESYADPYREERVAAKAIEARTWVLQQVAEKKQGALRSWISNRAGREYNFYGGDYIAYDQGRDKLVLYYGDLESKKPHGRGLMVFPDGTEYFGPFSEGVRTASSTTKEGAGTFKWPNGNVYVGDWFTDKMHGRGVLTYADGNVHDGTFQLGRPHGPGTLTLPDGVQLKGKWKNGTKDGEFWLLMPGRQKERREFVAEVAPRESEEDPVNFRVRYTVFEPTQSAEAEVLEATDRVEPPPSLLLACQKAVGLALFYRLEQYSPITIRRKVPGHLRAKIATELLENAVNDTSVAFRENSRALAWQEPSSCDLSGKYFKPYDLKLLAHFLGAATTSLVRLKLVGCYITADGAITVASILHYAHALTDLDLSYNPLDKDGGAVISRAVQAHPGLRTLALAGCKLSAKGTQAVCTTILCAPSCTLTSLDLSFNDMGPEGAGYVATALTRNRSLTQLNVRCNGFGPKGGALFADALPHNERCLKLLVIADNHIGERCATLLASRHRVGAKNVLEGFRHRIGAEPVTVPKLTDEEAEGQRLTLRTAIVQV